MKAAPGRCQSLVAALEGVFGIWAGRKDTPSDGLDYQRESRAACIPNR